MGNLCQNSRGVEEKKPSESARESDKTPQQKKYPYNWPVGAEQVGYLTERQVKARLKTQTEQVVDLPDGYRFRWAAVSQRGYYPSQADKANQDSFAVHIDMNGTGKHWFAVYDGHGPVGEKCSSFACEHVAKEFSKALKDGADARTALSTSHVKTNKMLAANSSIDDQQSGTTAITLYMDGRDLLISNVGDSRVMLGSVGDDGGLVTKSISTDQTPYRRDERERVKKYGARVMTADQIDGVEPIHENWDCKLGDEIDDGGDPPRIWAQDQEYPGTAFTRSIGDSLAESLGVIAEPEIDGHKLGPKDRVLIAASDGIFEFITTRSCIETALLYSDPLEACKALVGESYKLWIEREDRTDDITIILGFVEPPGLGDHTKPASTGHADVSTESIPVELPGGDAGGAPSPAKGGDKKSKTRRGSLNASAK
jgi:serine/threonine protein phosphatase PrpC